MNCHSLTNPTEEMINDKPIRTRSEGEGLRQMWAGATSGWYSAQNGANGVRGWWFQGGRCEQRPCLLLTELPSSVFFSSVSWSRPVGCPLLGNTTQMMDFQAHARGRHAHALFGHTTSHTLALCPVAAVICHLDPYQMPPQICPRIILLNFSRQKRFHPGLQMGSWHAKVMLD